MKKILFMLSFLILYTGCKDYSTSRNRYNTLKKEVDKGNYEEARNIFAEMIAYGDSDSRYVDSALVVLDKIPKDSTKKSEDKGNYDFTAGVESASEEQVVYVNEGLINGVSATNIKSYKSNSHSRAYFVSAELSGAGLNKQFACWLISGTKNKPGMILSVDSWASEYSTFPQRKQSVTIADRGYKILKRSY